MTKHNHGTQKVGGGIVQTYGKDSSDVALDNERGDSMGGSTTDLSHSLSGSSANQKGK